MSHECTKFHKALSEKLNIKKGERYDYEVIMRFLRVQLSFFALKATLNFFEGHAEGKGKSLTMGVRTSASYWTNWVYR